MDPKTKQNVQLLAYGVTLNDFGLALAPLCGHLLTFVGSSGAYKQLIRTFTSVLKPGGGVKVQGGYRKATRRPQGGHEEATRRPQGGNVLLAGPP